MDETRTDKHSITLEGHGLTLRRGDALVFDRLCFRLSAGGLLVVRGPNGSGKSSLLRAVAGFLPLEDGVIRCNGARFEARSDEADLRCFWYSPADGLAGALTAAQNLSLAPDAGSELQIKTKLAAYDPFVISGFLDQPVRSLSTGQRQRVALTRLCFAPSDRCLWLLDEPNSALDEAGHKALEGVLAAHQAAGGLCLMASHHQISDRLKPAYLDLSDTAEDR